MTKDPAHTSPTADDTDQDDLETTGTNVPDGPDTTDENDMPVENPSG